MAFSENGCGFKAAGLPLALLATMLLPDASEARGLEIISASFGALGRDKTLDIAAKLRSLCGPDTQSCQIFCSETTFGRYSLGRRPICRVTYRCSPQVVRSLEAPREEPILLQCPAIADSARADGLPQPPQIGE